MNNDQVEHCKTETRMNRVVPELLVALPTGCASGADVARYGCAVGLDWSVLTTTAT